MSLESPRTVVLLQETHAVVGGVAPRHGHSPSKSLLLASTHSSEMAEAATPLEPLKLLFLFIYLASMGISNWIVLAYVHDFVPRHSPLPDVVFAVVPQQEWALQVGDKMVTACIILLVVLVIFHAHSLLILRRLFFITGTLYAMRSVSLIVTQLPTGYVNSTAKCRPAEGNLSLATFMGRVLEQTINVGFQKDDGRLLCGDILFSGHTLVLITCCLFIYYYLPQSLKLLTLIPAGFAIFGMLCMVMCRTHYTIDVVVAYWLSSGVFTYCELDLYLDRRKSVLHSLLLMRIVDWLEENVVPGKVENTLRVPFRRFWLRVFGRDSGHRKQVSISSSSSF